MRLRPQLLIFGAAIICGMLFIGLAIPLINEAVPPNPYYGIRVENAYRSDELWYSINRYGGWAMTIAGLLMLIGNVILFFFRKKLSRPAYAGIFVGIILVSVLVATAITVAYADGLI